MPADQPGEPAATTDLFDRVVAGDRAAEEELIERYLDRLHRIAGSMFPRRDRLRRVHDTDDVRQGATIRLLRAIRAEQPASSAHFRRLFGVVVRRELIDLARKGVAGKPRAESLDGGGSEGDGLHAGLAADDTGPETAAGRQEVLEAVDGLPDELREVIDLIQFGGFTYAEAADSLGVSESTVKRRWYDAREELHRRLRG